MPTKTQTWDHFKQGYFFDVESGLSLDLSRMDISEQFVTKMKPKLVLAYEKMKELEAGAVANPDESRMVGHYWLRAPELAPDPKIQEEIEQANKQVLDFAHKVHSAIVKPEKKDLFKNVLSIGIGGSALGPMFVADALGTSQDRMSVHFMDNTDPDGIDRILKKLDLKETLTLVISKSGGTPETLNGMIEAQRAYERAGLDFAEHAVAITGEGSVLDKQAQNWLQRFPMWDWVGGRTSVMSTVGLVPAALQGLDVEQFLKGAAHADRLGRKSADPRQNPAMALALAWYRGGDGKGSKDMVILPYKDRLALFSRYLQQLVMESLGKEKDLQGNVVHQGIAVYGNKGSTDQHAYVQQLRDGLNNFFATFIVVLKDRHEMHDEPVQGTATTGDFLHGFWLGTREALSSNGRLNLTITIPDVTPFHVGALIAIYERAVGYYASFVSINAYHQPGVEAGKKAAAKILALQEQILSAVQQPVSVQELASALNAEDQAEAVYFICQHLVANGRLIGTGTGTELRVSSPKT